MFTYEERIGNWKESVKRWKNSYELAKKLEMNTNTDLEAIGNSVEALLLNIKWKLEKDGK